MNGPTWSKNSGACIVAKSLVFMQLGCGQMNRAGFGFNAAHLDAMARPLTGRHFRGGTQPIRLVGNPEKIREPQAAEHQERGHPGVAKRAKAMTMMCGFEVHVSLCCYNYVVGSRPA